MFNVLNYFKDNRKKVIIIAICILVIIYAIKVYFEYSNEENNEHNSNSSSSNSTTAIVKNEVINNTAVNNIKNTIAEKQVTSSSGAINKFVDYCNSNNTDGAYNMLTDDCKSVVFNNNKQEFIDKYEQSFFDKAKVCKITSLGKGDGTHDVYKVTLSEDPLTTGVTDKSQSKVDYITVVNIDGNYKLNISNFIKKEPLNVNKRNSYMEITVLDRLVYADYEIYTINVKNEILVDFLLDDMTSDIKTYLEDSEGNKFKIMNNEYTSETVRVPNGKEANISLKFDRKFLNNNKEIKKLIFSRIKVINRNYYKEVTNTIDNTINYEEQMSTYPTVLDFEIEF